MVNFNAVFIMSKITTKIKQQTYRKEWEKVPEFEGWLQPVPGEQSRAYCSICEKTLHAHKLGLLQHTSTLKHTRRAQAKCVTDKWKKSNEEQSSLVKNVDQIDFYYDTDTSNDDSLASNNLTPSNVSQSTQPVYNSELNMTEQSVEMPPISTQVVDTSKGIPVQNLLVTLYKFIDGSWTFISKCTTNPVGECDQFISREDFRPGTFKLHFDIYKYFMLHRQTSMFPFIEVVFDVHSPKQHLKIPLFLTPFGYSVYKS